MVKTYDSHIWTRTVWQAKRDEAKIPKGACLRVSVGDELDRFHKEVAKGVGPNLKKAAERLAEKIAAYAKSVHSKYPAWEKRVKLQILDRAVEMQTDIDKMLKAKEEYNKGVLIVSKIWDVAKHDILEHLASRGGTKLKSKALDGLIAGFKAIHLQGERLAYVTDEVGEDIWKGAKTLWMAVDGEREMDKAWLDKAENLRGQLRGL